MERPEDLKDVQGRYGYEKKRREGADEEEAFLYARERARDYSRGMVDWQRAKEQEENSLHSVYRRLLAIRKGFLL